MIRSWYTSYFKFLADERRFGVDTSPFRFNCSRRISLKEASSCKAAIYTWEITINKRSLHNNKPDFKALDSRCSSANLPRSLGNKILFSELYSLQSPRCHDLFLPQFEPVLIESIHQISNPGSSFVCFWQDHPLSIPFPMAWGINTSQRIECCR